MRDHGTSSRDRYQFGKNAKRALRIDATVSELDRWLCRSTGGLCARRISRRTFANPLFKRTITSAFSLTLSVSTAHGSAVLFCANLSSSSLVFASDLRPLHRSTRNATCENSTCQIILCASSVNPLKPSVIIPLHFECSAP